MNSLIAISGISSTLAKLNKNEYVSLESIVKIRYSVKCNIVT